MEIGILGLIFPNFMNARQDLINSTAAKKQSMKHTRSIAAQRTIMNHENY
ncbi:MAG: hypothetical protein LKM30_04365 [Bacilli bacterium]|nr:hypothetical protein [Bacilli bacterium]